MSSKKFKLRDLLNNADIILVDGYEADHCGLELRNDTNELRWNGGDDRANFSNQEVELSEDGCCTAADTEGESHDFDFRLITPMSPEYMAERMGLWKAGMQAAGAAYKATQEK